MCDKCGWAPYVDQIGGALEDIEGDTGELPESAEEFNESVREKLESIGEWVEEHQHITKQQASAVDNMIAALGRWKERY